MKVGIFETDHFEGAFPVIRSFDNGHNDITIFTVPASYQQFTHLFRNELDHYSWIVKNEQQSKRDFIRVIEKEVKSRGITVLYLNTISDNHLLYAMMVRRLPAVRVIVTFHCINSYFRYVPSFKIKRIVRYIGRKALIRAVKEYNVVSQVMVDHLVSKLPGGKKVYCVPGAFFEEAFAKQLQPPLSQRINIVIAGSVDGRRRDYSQVFTLLDRLESMCLPVTITLLGHLYGEYGQNIAAQCAGYKGTHTAVNYYGTTTVDQAEFERVLLNAHFVWIPSVIDTIIEDGVAETYGKSISSGNVFDIIRHAKPFIIPKTLNIDAPLLKSCFTYANVNEIADWLLQLHQSPFTYQSLLANAFTASKEFTLEKIRNRNRDLFLSNG